MKILVTNHWLKKWGGSETFTYTLIEELVRLGHDVDLFTLHPGLVSDRIKTDFNINIRLQKKYDLVLANHNTTVKTVRYAITSRIVQTCHGTIPSLEQPDHAADTYVAISEEVQQHLRQKSFKSVLIHNGINCDRFKPQVPITACHPEPVEGLLPKTILSMVFSDAANTVIKQACDMLGIKLITLNKHKNPVFNVAHYMNKADLVIGLGRCAYEAMACGRPVIVYDARPYMPSYADGYLDPETLTESIKYNCSGRRFKKEFTANDLVTEIQKYNPQHGDYLRNFALNHLNIQTQVQKYLNL